MSNKKILIITILILITVIGIVAVSGLMSSEKVKQSEVTKIVTKTYMLGEAEIKGYVGVELTYDVKPESIKLISNNNKSYDIQTADKYIDDSANKKLTMLVDTGDLCKWTVSVTTASSSNFDFKFINEPSPTLYVNDPKLVKNGRYYYVQFDTVTSDMDNIDATCSVYIESDDKKYDITTASIKINNQSCVRFEPPIEAFSNEKYTVVVTVKTNNQTAAAQFDLELTSSTDNTDVEISD